jgi:hypothetical protein
MDLELFEKGSEEPNSKRLSYAVSGVALIILVTFGICFFFLRFISERHTVEHFMDAVVAHPKRSKPQACMKGDHAWRAIGAQAHAEEPGWRRDSVGSRTEPGLRRGLSWNTSQHDAG